MQTPEVTLLAAEHLREAPNGDVIARLVPGARVGVVRSQGSWLEVELEGSVWLASLSSAVEGPYSLVVSARDGENLRSKPSGEILARLEEGALLMEVGREPGWARVRRRGYLWAQSARSEGTGSRTLVGAGSDGAAIVAAPGADTLAFASPGAPMLLGGRRGGWVRVRIDGWTWLPPGDLPRPGGDLGAGPSPEELRASPEIYAGHTIVWELRYISTERSGPGQSDFLEGEIYLLCRWGSDDHFVYVALENDQLGLAVGLAPLEEVRVTGRVRTGASALTKVPVIDLIALERGRNRR